MVNFPLFLHSGHAIDNYLFSKFHYKLVCNKSSESTEFAWHFIEPLVGILRDPFTICPGFVYPVTVVPPLNHDPIQSKLFLLTAAQAPFIRFNNAAATLDITKCVNFDLGREYDGQNCAFDTPLFLRRLLNVHQQNIGQPALGLMSRVYLFDIGCSYYRSTNGVIFDGGKWLVDQFELRNIAFDKIFGFEFTVMNSREFWLQIPEHLMATYTLINVGVTSEMYSRFNPLTLLHRMSTAQDYVVLKLDIDTPAIETVLMAQIEMFYMDLVDELFFEHHVDTPPMHNYWGSEEAGNIADSYAMFLRLRNKGVRAHSWP